MKFIFLSIAILFFLSLNAQVSFSDLSLPYGKYDVGFKHYIRYDSTRTYARAGDWDKKITARPIPVSLWFPQKESQKRTMTIEDYM